MKIIATFFTTYSNIFCGLQLDGYVSPSCKYAQIVPRGLCQFNEPLNMHDTCCLQSAIPPLAQEHHVLPSAAILNY